MSYARWSSDNWKCDVYCYEDVSGGWTTHVAANRVVGDVPEEADFLTATNEEWLISHNKAMEYLEKAERQSIGLPYDGETFNDSTLEEFKDRLIMLRSAGYNVPDYVFETIDEEIAEEIAKEDVFDRPISAHRGKGKI